MEEDDDELLPLVKKLKDAMLDSLEKRFQYLYADPLYKLATSLDPRWKSTFGYDSPADFTASIKSFELSIGNPFGCDAPDVEVVRSNQTSQMEPDAASSKFLKEFTLLKLLFLQHFMS